MISPLDVIFGILMTAVLLNTFRYNVKWLRIGAWSGVVLLSVDLLRFVTGNTKMPLAIIIAAGAMAIILLLMAYKLDEPSETKDQNE